MRELRLGEVAAFGLATAALAIWTVASIHLIGDDPGASLRVFGGFWSSGWAANRGLDPYGIYPLVPRTFVAGLYDLNLNAPAWLPLFQLLALGEPHAVAVPWVASGAVIFVLVLYVLVRSAPQPVAAWRIFFMLLMTPVRDTIWLAQNYALIFLAASVGWYALKRGHGLAAGLAIGVLAAMKPNFLLWPAYLLLVGELRVAIIAGGMFAALSVLPALLDGPAVYVNWLRMVGVDAHWMVPINISLSALCRRSGVAWLGPVLSVGLIGGTAYVVRHRQMDVARASVVALCVSILAAPLAWGDYALVLVPAFIDGLWGKLCGVAAVLLMVPIRFSLATMSQSRGEQFLGSLVPLLPICIVLWNNLKPVRDGAADIGDERKEAVLF